MASTSNRKRSRSGAGREHPGDPPTESPAFLGVENSTFKGVRERVIVEIKPWPEKKAASSSSFYREVPVPKKSEVGDGVVTGVATAKVKGALIHDMARAYLNPGVPVDQLNITRVETWIRRDVLKVEIIDSGSFIGKDELDKYVQEHPPSTERTEWEDLNKVGLESLKEEIKKHGLEFFKVLTAAIDKDVSLAGRRRKDEAQIPDTVQHMEESDPKEKEIQDLKETHAAELRAKDAVLREKDKEISSLNQKIRNLSLSGTGILIQNKSPFLEDENPILPPRPAVLDAECVQDHIAKEVSRVGCERQGEVQILDFVQHVEESDPKEVRSLNMLKVSSISTFL